MTHPDLALYAEFSPLSTAEVAVIEEHLRECGECRDLVVFIRKTNATLRQAGRISRVADALRMKTEDLKREMQLGTTVTEIINRSAESPLNRPVHPMEERSPVKK
jgi:predicted anti-sigma-YlaC factor YlaD